MKEVKFIDINLDESKFVMENEEVIEYEISDEISLMYDKGKKKFYIYGIDYNELFDEFIVDIDEESFNGITIDGITINKEDFDEFKELVAKVA